jgi:hypothetical protein
MEIMAIVSFSFIEYQRTQTKNPFDKILRTLKVKRFSWNLPYYDIQCHMWNEMINTIYITL